MEELTEQDIKDIARVIGELNHNQVIILVGEEIAERVQNIYSTKLYKMDESYAEIIDNLEFEE